MNTRSKSLGMASTANGNEATSLEAMSKEDLIVMVKTLQSRNHDLEKTFMEKFDKRLEILERVQNSSLQYLRRDTVEISGIPVSVSQEKLEDEVIKLFNTAGVEVDGHKLDKLQIHACHRIGSKGATVVKTVNRKFAEQSLYCSKNLKGKSPYPTEVYINSSFCKEYSFLNFVVRKAKQQGHIHRYKVKKGVTLVQLVENGDFKEITHKVDLIKCNIDIDNIV